MALFLRRHVRAFQFQQRGGYYLLGVIDVCHLEIYDSIARELNDNINSHGFKNSQGILERIDFFLTSPPLQLDTKNISPETEDKNWEYAFIPDAVKSTGR